MTKHRWPDGQVREEEPYRCGAFISATGEQCTLLSDHEGKHSFASELIVADALRAALEQLTMGKRS